MLVPSEFVGAEVVHARSARCPSRVDGHAPRLRPRGARDLPPAGSRAPSEPYVLTVSRVDARKNHLRMLAAFERLVKEGLPHRWIVAGPRGHGGEEFERALASSPARERVEWRRVVADARAAAALRAGRPVPVREPERGLRPAAARGDGLRRAGRRERRHVAARGARRRRAARRADRRASASSRPRAALLTEPELARELDLRGRARAREFTWKETRASHAARLPEGDASPSDEDEPKLRRSL